MLRNVVIVLLCQVPGAAAFALPSAAGRWGAAALWAALQTFLLVHLLSPRSVLWGPLIWKGLPQRRVALTFDDGPHPEDTPAILDLLRAEGVKATFFFVGGRARAHPGLVRRAAEEGHEVGAHSDSHPWWFSMASPGRIRREVRASAETLERLAGRPLSHFRPPMGHKSIFLQAELAARALTMAGWTTRAFDTLPRSSAAIRDAIVSRAVPGGIVLLHEGTRRAPGRPSSTVAALPGIIEGLRRRGLEPVSLEILRAAPPAAGPPMRSMGESAAAGGRGE
ncbi:MAG TPA: polysaccharide deacetylase family protein [Candidatus Polarisedimenticolia bacterium]|nr:polysaccharide deacetylase family protein [Candidatus Polarisedimenticolia bacterium]